MSVSSVCSRTDHGLFFRDVISARDKLPLLNPFLFGKEETNPSRKNKSTRSIEVTEGKSSASANHVQNVSSSFNSFVAKTCSS